MWHITRGGTCSCEFRPAQSTDNPTAAERARDEARELLDAQSSGAIVQVNRRAALDRDAARHLLVSLVDPEAATHAAESEIPKARELIRRTLGTVVVNPGKAPVEERVSFERHG